MAITNRGTIEPPSRTSSGVALRYASIATLLLGCVTLPLKAQLKSVPVYPLLAARPGWAAGLDYGSGLNDASGHARYWGARVGLGTSRVRFTAAGGAWNAGASTSAQVGGTGLIRLVGLGSGGLALHALAGAGYARSGPRDSAATYVTIPVGLALAHSGLRTSRGAVTPWLAPIMELNGVSFGAVRSTQAGVGLSGGLAATVHRRIGLHVALEGVRLLERRAAGVTLQEGTRVTAGAGIHLLLAGPQ